ncbi:MAG: hypothetical protein FD550_000284 [Pelagibacterales bacterium]|jgi:hypothetical protein|nr:hypothetical protein [Pelagibacterales bacterium]
MSLTNTLLFLILVTLTTYTFMPWKGIDKGSKLNIFIQFISWAIIFGIALFISNKLNLLQ